MTRASVDPDGRFKTFQMPPGRYTIRAQNIGSAWSLKSAAFKDHDVADTPIDLGSEDIGDVVITMTDRPSSLSGTVLKHPRRRCHGDCLRLPGRTVPLERSRHVTAAIPDGARRHGWELPPHASGFR